MEGRIIGRRTCAYGRRVGRGRCTESYLDALFFFFF